MIIVAANFIVDAEVVAFFSPSMILLFLVPGNMLDELERIYRRAGSRKLWSDIFKHANLTQSVSGRAPAYLPAVQTVLDPRGSGSC